MIIIELLYNLFALLALSVIANFIDQKYDRRTFLGQILQGILFGAIALIGMMNPYVLAEGIFFDGRSIVISLSTLIFGPITGIIATSVSLFYRIFLGGTGVFMGVAVIILSFIWGLLFFILTKKGKVILNNTSLFVFGVLVTASMILCSFLLPIEKISSFLYQVAPTVIIFYPLITLANGRIILNQLNFIDSLVALKESEEILKTTLYSIGDAVITTDKYGKILRMNSKAQQLTEWSEIEASGKSLEDIFIVINEVTKEKAVCPIVNVIENGVVVNLANNSVLISKSGKEYPIIDSAAPIKIKDELFGVVLVFRDQTEERKKIKQIEESEKFHKFLIANLPGFVYRCAYDKNWTMYYISDGCYDVTGFKPQEFLNNNPVFNDIILPEQHNEIYELWERALALNIPFEHTYKIITKSGEIKWVWEKGRGVFSDSGELLYLEGYITDVTEKRVSHLKLEESEKKFKIISNLISDYLFSTRIEKDGTSITDWFAGAFEEITGYSFEEYLAIGGWSATLHPDDFEIDKEALQKILNNQEAICEVRIFHKSGKIVWVRVFAYPVWDEIEKRVTGIIGAVQDITAIKKQELISTIEVKVSQAVLRDISEYELFEIIRQDLSLLVDIKNFFIAFYNKESGLLRSLVESDEKDNIPIWKAKGSLTGYLLEQNKTLCLNKNELKNLLNENKFNLIGTLPEQWLGVPIKIYNEVVGAIVIQDYSNPNAFDEYIIRIMENLSNFLSIFLERKRKEQQIIESEERFRNLFENQEAILLLIDAESGMIIDANKSAQQFYKSNLDELKDKTIFDIDLAEPEKLKKYMIEIYKGTQNKFEAKHRLADGQIRDVELYTSLITIKNHKFFYSIVFDKTEQKQAEKELQLLKTAIIQNPAIIIITNLKGEIEFVNPKYTECTQYKLEEVKGRKTHILKSGFHSDEFYEQLWNKIKNGENWHGEILNKRKDGSLFWVESIISPIMDRNGRITHYVAVQEDITQRKKMMENLIKSEEEFRSVWENSVDAMRLVDEHGIVVNVNKAYCELFKMKRNQLVGKPFNVAYVIKDTDRTLDAFIQRFKLRTIRKKFETDILLHDGSIIWVELTSAFIEIKNSPPLLLSIFRDITSNKKLIKETIEAKEKAEEMNRVKSYFFANMSHELRTPLVGILGFADILKEELEDNPELSKMAELITKSGQRLHETLNLILNLSKLEAGKLEVKLNDENIIPHIKTSFNLFEQAARKKGLNYILKLPNNEVICRIDPNLVQNVLNNLINNAIKFTAEGSVTVELDTIGSKARIQIIDTGIGIPKEHQSVIWEEFRQVSEGLNRSFEGTGLGLTIVKRFTSLMGGKVYLESEENKGSNFILEFPLVEKPNDQEIIESYKSKKSVETKLSKKNQIDLLYVEDDQSSVDLVSLMLKNKYDFDVARTPEEALIKVKQNSYRAILMDINLKQTIDGVQLTALIRKIDGYENIPIAAITAYRLGKDKEAFLSQGMTHYLSKPFSKTDLLELINKMLNKQNTIII